ncbi:MAG: hypothetical protein KatS3mg034_0224 [Vicingaceae bacterium]|nr:MAG: hypothetical protein KatS3mg034_0224 [Vicingaceae bacterium]
MKQKDVLKVSIASALVIITALSMLIFGVKHLYTKFSAAASLLIWIMAMWIINHKFEK